MGNVIMSGIVPPLEKPVGGTPISDVAVGSTLKLAENGSLVDYLVVHSGRPSTLYDSSCDGIWLLRKDCYTSRAWDSTNNDYANSDIHTYLNNTFLGLFDASTKNAIKQVKIPYRAGSGSSNVVTSGANGLSAKVFLLSATEVSFGHSYIPSNEGAELSYFSGCADTAADSKRIAYLNGSAIYWYLRSPYCNSSVTKVTPVTVVLGDGSYYNGTAACTVANGIRPALILPSTALITEAGTVIAA